MAGPAQVVLLIHGIRTHAEWQERVKEILEEDSTIEVRTSRYGRFDPFRFLFPLPVFLPSPIAKVRRDLTYLREEYPEAKISVLAHSFGTFLLGRVLREEGDIRLHRVVLCGSVQKEDYPWQYLIQTEMVREVVNDCGWRDIWPLMARSLSWHYGAAGVFGFHGAAVENRFHDLGHSDFLRPWFARTYWKPFFSHGEGIAGSAERPTMSWWRILLGTGNLKYALLAVAAMVLVLLVVLWPGVAPGEEWCGATGELRVVPSSVLLETGGSHRLAVGRCEVGGFSPLSAELWRSDDDRIARVAATGDIEAIAPGSTGVLSIVRDAGGAQVAARGRVEVQDLRAASSGSFLERLLPDPRVSILVTGDFDDVVGDERGRVGGVARVKTLRDQLRQGAQAVGVLGMPGLGEAWKEVDARSVVKLWGLLDGDGDRRDDRLLVAGVDEPLTLRALASGEAGFPWLAGENRASLWTVGDLRLGMMLLAGSNDPESADPRHTAGWLRDQGADLVVAVQTEHFGNPPVGLLEGGAVDVLLTVGDASLGTLSVGNRWRFDLDATGRSALVLDVVRRGDNWRLEYRSVELGGELAPDPELEREVQGVRDFHLRRLCEGWGEAPDCLTAELGRSETDLVAGLESIRTVETSMGNWVADTLLASVPGADVAFVNAGALRLHDTIPAGGLIRRLDIYQLLPFGNSPVAVRLSGRELRAVIEHSAASWGQGGWLQVAGLAFRFDPEAQTVEDLTLLGSEGPRPVWDDDKIVAVTIDFLTQAGDDYDMLSDAPRLAEPDVRLRDLAIERLVRARVIAPRAEGRICYPSSLPDQCRAVRSERRLGDRLP